MADTVEIILKATDQASDALNNVGGAMDRLGGIAGGVLKAGLALGAAGLTTFVGVLGSSFKAAVDAEQVHAQLDAVIRSTGGAAGLTAEEVKAMASAYQEVTRFGDDTILSGQSLLLTFTNIGKDVFPLATETMLDMSQALGQDLKSSATQLGKALQDPITGITALSRVGVNFTEAQKEQIKAMVEAGDVAGAQTLILKELQVEFGGSARAAGQTFAGQLDILKNAFGDVQKEIGFALLPIVRQLFDEWSPRMVDAAQKAGALLSAFIGGDSEKAKSILIDIFGAEMVRRIEGWGATAQTVIAALRTGFDTIVNTVGPPLVAFFEGAARTIGGTWDNLRNIASTALGNIRTAIDNARPTLQAAWDTVVSIFNQIRTGDFAGALAAIGSIIAGIVRHIGENQEAWRKEIGDKLSAVLSAAATWVQDNVAPRVTALWAGIRKWAETAFGYVKDHYREWGDTAGAFLLSALGAAATWVSTNIGPQVTALWGSVQKWATDTWAKIDENKGAWAADIGGRVGDALSAAAAWLQSNVGPHAAALWAAIKAWVAGAFDTLKDPAKRAEFVDSLRENLRKTVTEAADRLGIETETGKANELADKIGSWISGSLTQKKDELAAKLGPALMSIIDGSATEAVREMTTPESNPLVRVVGALVDQTADDLQVNAEQRGADAAKGLIAILTAAAGAAALVAQTGSIHEAFAAATAEGVAKATEKRRPELIKGAIGFLKGFADELTQAATGREDTGFGPWLDEEATRMGRWFDDMAVDIESGTRDWGDKIRDAVGSPGDADSIIGKASAKMDEFRDMILDVTAEIGPEMEKLFADPSNPESVWAKLATAWETINDAGKTAWEAIRDAILEPVGELPQKIYDWFVGGEDSVKAKLESIDLAATGKAILESLWSGLKAKWQEILAWFGGVISTINGLLASINAAVQAARGAADTAEAAWRRAGQAQPPRAHHPPGMGPGDEVPGFGIPPEAAFQSSIADTTRSLAGLRSLSIGIVREGPDVRGAIDDVMDAVDRLGLSLDDIERARQVIDQLRALKEALEFRNLLADWTDDVKGKIAGRIQVLGAVIMMAASEFNRIAQAGPAITDGAGELAERLPGALRALEAASAFRNVLAEWTDDVKGKVAARIDVLGTVIEMVVDRFNRSTWVQPLSEAARAMLDSLGPVISILQATVSFRNALAEWTDEVKDKIGPRVAVLVSVLGLVAQAINQVVREGAAWVQPLSKAAREFLDSLGPVLSILQTTISLRNGLATWEDELQGKIAARVAVLVSVLGIVAAELNRAADEAGQWLQPLSEAAQTFLDSLGPVLSVLQSTVSFRNALADWADDLQGKIQPRVAVLVAVLQTVAEQLSRAALPPITDAVRAFAERVQPLTSAMQSAISLLRAMVDIEFPSTVIPQTYLILANMLEIIGVAQRLLPEIAAELDEQGLEIPDAVARRLRLWSERIAPLAGIISGAVGALRALIDVQLPREIVPQTYLILANMLELLRVAERVLTDIVLELDEEGIELPDAVRVKLERWNARIAPLAGVLNSAQAALRAIVDVQLPRTIIPQTYLILANMLEILEVAGRVLPGIAAELDDDGLEIPDQVRQKLERWNARIAPLAGVINAAVGAVKALVEIEPGRDLDRRTGQVLADMQAILAVTVAQLGEIATQLDEEGLEIPDDVRLKLERWAARISPLANVITGAVNAIKGLAETPSGVNIETAARSVAQQITRLVGVFDELLPQIELSADGVDALQAKLGQWSARVQAVAGIVSSGLTTLKGLAEFRDAPVWATNFWAVLFVQQMKDVIERIGSLNVSDAALTAIERLQRVVGHLPGIVEAMGSLRNYERMLPAWIDAFKQDVIAVLDALAEAAAAPQGFTLGQGFGQGFVEGFRSATSEMPWPSPLATEGGAGFAVAAAPVNVNISGTFHIREEADITKLAQQLGQMVVLRRRGGLVGGVA